MDDEKSDGGIRITSLAVYDSFRGMAEPSQTGVYIAGYTEDANGSRVPCYWKNGARVDLSAHDLTWPTVGTNGGTALSVAVSDDDVIIAGSFFDTLGVEKPCLWRNKVASHLPMIDPAKNGDANGVFIVGGEVYVSGQLYNAFCAYEKVSWHNEVLQKYKLPMEESGSGASAVYAEGKDVYLAGYYFPPVMYATTATYFPCYWKNGIKSVLPKEDPESQNGFATGVWKKGSDIYICGHLNEKTELQSSYPCYWKNNLLQRLPVISQGEPGWAWGICATDGDVYVAGHCRSERNAMTPCYWRNGERIDLKVSNGAHGWARAVAVSGTDLYVTGYYQKTSGVIAPCYWKNGVLVDLPVTDPYENGKAFGIFIHQK